MVFHEKHAGEDDVGRCDVVPALDQRVGIALPVGRGVNAQLQARQFVAKAPARRRNGASHMAVERDHRHADRDDTVADRWAIND